MPRRCVWLLVVLLAVVAGPARAEEFWGRMLPDQPGNFIFGYGSLINTESRDATSSHPIAAIAVRVSAAFGYIRAWNDRSPSGFTALGLRKAGPGESGMTINGVVYPVEGNDMAAFDVREQGYIRLEVPRADIEAVSWQALPAQGRIWVYVPDVAGRVAGTGLSLPDAKFPMLESYIDIVIQGGLEYSPEFAREIIVTTKDWSPYWLNDRELARRPWVFDKQYAAVDKLLSGFAPHFADRMFSEEYTAKYLVGGSTGSMSPAR
jgi:hypothetical protein